MTKPHYSITTTCGTGGHFVPSGPQSITEDETLDVQIVPDAGYAVQSVILDGRQLPEPYYCSPSYPEQGYHYRFAQTRKNHTISVTFAPIGQFEVWLVNPPVVDHRQAGMLFKTPDAPKYLYNAHVTVRAVPASGYHFAGWTGDMMGRENPITVVVTRDLKLSADFAEGEPEPAPVPIEERVADIETRLTKAGL